MMEFNGAKRGKAITQNKTSRHYRSYPQIQASCMCKVPVLQKQAKKKKGGHNNYYYLFYHFYLSNVFELSRAYHKKLKYLSMAPCFGKLKRNDTVRKVGGGKKNSLWFKR